MATDWRGLRLASTSAHSRRHPRLRVPRWSAAAHVSVYPARLTRHRPPPLPARPRLWEGRRGRCGGRPSGAGGGQGAGRRRRRGAAGVREGARDAVAEGGLRGGGADVAQRGRRRHGAAAAGAPERGAQACGCGAGAYAPPGRTRTGANATEATPPLEKSSQGLLTHTKVARRAPTHPSDQQGGPEWQPVALSGEPRSPKGCALSATKTWHATQRWKSRCGGEVGRRHGLASGQCILRAWAGTRARHRLRSEWCPGGKEHVARRNPSCSLYRPCTDWTGTLGQEAQDLKRPWTSSSQL